MKRPSTSPPRLWSWLSARLLRGLDGSVVRADIDEAFERDLANGHTLRSARSRYARNVLGSVVSVRAAGLRGAFGRGLSLDARLGLRMLGKQPVLTLVAMMALGLGIPSTLSVYHLMGELVSPLPVPNGDEVFGVRNVDRRTGPVEGGIHDFEHWQSELTLFQSLGAADSRTLNVRTGEPGDPPVRGARITASGLEVMQTVPLAGRLFGPEDEVDGAPNVILLGESLWRARFGGDPELVGETVMVGSSPHTVVGILPETFEFPNHARAWIPLRLRATAYEAGLGPRLLVFGRLVDGADLDQAKLEASLHRARSVVDRPAERDHVWGEVVPMPLLLLGEDDFRLTDPEYLLGYAVLFLSLMLVCGNIGVLVLARTATRTGEITVRTALGASRGRIVSQIFVETLMLALVATGSGLLLAQVFATVVMTMAEPHNLLPYWVDLRLDAEIVLVGLGLAVASAGVAGVLPAMKATRRSVQGNLQRTAAGTSTVRFGLAPSLLIVAEVVLSVGFIAMGTMMARGLFQDTEGQLGFDPDRYVVGALTLPRQAASGETVISDVERIQQLTELQSEVVRRVRQADGVVAAAFGEDLPGDLGGTRGVILEEPGPEVPGVWPLAKVATVGFDFFQALDRDVVAGRDFGSADVQFDTAAGTSPVIVNTSFVASFLGAQPPLGRRFRYRTRNVDPSEYEWFEIVGVVGPFGTNVANPARDAAVYHPMAAGDRDEVRLIVEVPTDPAAFVGPLRSIVSDVNPDAVLMRAQPLTVMMNLELNFYRLAFLAQIGLAAVAFLLSVSGLYALLSFTVAQRTREIGIRSALGARPLAIMREIATRAALQLGAGLALGGVWSWVLLESVELDMIAPSVSRPAVIAVTLLFAAVVGALACAQPTLRGIRIQPTEALRDF